MKYVTESDIPFEEAFLMPDRFVMLNMLYDGIWYVDREHSLWEKMKETALGIAKRFGDKQEIARLNIPYTQKN